MIAAFRVLHILLGLAAIAICLLILFLGPSWTAGFFEAQFDRLSGSAHAPTGPWPATMDSELRFYAPLWGAYGLALLAVARDLPANLRFVPPLAALFFIGGVGRAISHVRQGRRIRSSPFSWRSNWSCRWFFLRFGAGAAAERPPAPPSSAIGRAASPPAMPVPCLAKSSISVLGHGLNRGSDPP